MEQRLQAGPRQGLGHSNNSRHGAKQGLNAGLLSRFLSAVAANNSKHRGNAMPGLLSAQLGGRGPAGSASPFAGLSAAGVVCHALAPQQTQSAVVSKVSLGFSRGLEDKYTMGRELGKGGNGRVCVVSNKATGAEFACKVIPKVLSDAASEKKRSGHLDSIVREVQVLSILKGSLNIVKLEDVYEDDDFVYVIMEQCKGGELHHAIGQRHYSERTAASYMRAVLRTLAQCHAHNVLHRDIKPGNFMLLNDDERSPLKAIDFGLATPFEPDQLPRTDLGLEGTPWYMAPETLRSEWLPASDVWAAGVMAYQLLTGRFPFDDFKNSFNPSISAIWKSVLCDDLDFKKAHWEGISDEAKDFVAMLLDRDPHKRPSAKDALKHPWLKGNSSERSTGKRISAGVVQSIQRYASSSVFKRTILQSIAAELLEQEPEPQSDSANNSQRGITDPHAPAMEQLFKQFNLHSRDTVDKDSVAETLRAMGFKLEQSEIDRLMEQVDIEGTGELDKSALAASQLDWRAMQRNKTEDWLELTRRAFENIDRKKDGVLDVDDLIAHLRKQLPPDEVQEAVAMALHEAGATAETGIDFPQFLELLRVGSLDSLDIYDDAMSRGSYGSLDKLNSILQQSLDWSKHGPGIDSVRSGKEAAAYLQDRSNHSDNSSHGGTQHGIQFRFDVGSSPAAVPPSQQTAFRFDVGPEKAAAAAASVPAAPPASTTAASAALVPPSPAAGAASSVSGVMLNVGRIGGYCDRQMHGGSLYKNTVMRSLNLETVRE